MEADLVKPIRPAASILIVRDGTKGLEVVTMKRSPSMRFLPGYLSFPGGSLQEDDWKLARTRMKGEIIDSNEDDDRVYAVAAIRETVEEIGWLPAIMGQAGKPTSLEIPNAVQAALLEEKTTLLDILAGDGWWLDAGRLRSVGRWVTPAHMPARFDTRFFFVIGTEIGESFSVHESENVWAKWCRPADLLSAIANGNEQAVPPTIAMLKNLAKAPNTTWCLQSLSVPGPAS